MRKGLLHAALTALVVGLGVLGMRRCAPPPPPPGDLSRPGHDAGQRPPRLDRDITVTVNPRGNSFTEADLKELACGTPYKITSVASENAACAGYDYRRLASIAEGSFLQRYLALSCPPGCGPKNLRRTYLKFECAGTRATVATKLEVVCPREGEVPPRETIDANSFSMTAATEAILPGENRDLAPPSRRGELIADLTVGATMSYALNCGDIRTFAVRYEENDPGRCAGITDYTPYVNRAVERAKKTYHDLLTCPPGCALQPFATMRREWGCDADTSNVVVKIWFSAECRRQ